MSATGVGIDTDLESWVSGELGEVRRRLDIVAVELRRLGTTEDMELLGAEHALRRAAFFLGALSSLDLRGA